MKKLTDLEIRDRLAKIPGWHLHDGKIERSYVFPDFARAVVFVNRAVNPIEEMQHHPNITIAYNRVTLTLITHDVKALTTKDFDLAVAIEALHQGRVN